MVDRQPVATDPRPIVALIREAISGDSELAEMLTEARRYRLPATRLPLALHPAHFTTDALARMGEPPPAPEWKFGSADPWRCWFNRRIRHRIAQLLTEFFGRLCAGELRATGLVPGGFGTVVAVPASLWSAPQVVVDLGKGGLRASGSLLFAGVDVALTSARQPLSEAAARRYLATFASEMAAAGCLFTTTEATALLQEAFPDAPMAATRQVTRLLRELGPTAWAMRRRPTHMVPGGERLAEAQRKAFHEAFAA